MRETAMSPGKGLMEETLLCWTLNGTPQAPFLCSAGDAGDLLLGHMIASGAAADPASVRCEETASGWQVSCALKPNASAPLPGRLDALPPLRSELTLSAAEVEAALSRVMALDHGTGLHAILLWDGEQTALGRDIGRHNAVEKAVGQALRTGMRLDRAVLCSSGRLSLEMMAKAAFSGIPVIATRKQVGTLCAEYARKLGIAVCHLGGEAACYGAAWRVTGIG